VGKTPLKELMRFKHLLNRAVAWGYLRESPARAIKKTREAPGRVRYLTAEEPELLLNGRRETVTASDGRTVDDLARPRSRAPTLDRGGTPERREAW
jgi:hypothetical protein